MLEIPSGSTHRFYTIFRSFFIFFRVGRHIGLFSIGRQIDLFSISRHIGLFSIYRHIGLFSIGRHIGLFEIYRHIGLFSIGRHIGLFSIGRHNGLFSIDRQFFVIFGFFLEYVGTLASFQSASHHYFVVSVQYQGYPKGESM